MSVAPGAHPRGAPTRVLVERADSVAGIGAAFARIWDELARGGMTERLVAGRATSLARTRVVTLVIVAARPETVERAMDAMLKLAGRHPSRTIVLALGDPTGPPALDARVQAHCHPIGGSNEVCTERVFLRLSGDACQHPAAVAGPLLLHDLPVALWWADDPPIGDRRFAELAAAADRLLVDSGLFRDDGAERLLALAAGAAGGLEVHDMGWMRLEPWRRLLAALCDDPPLAPFLRGIARVRLTVARPGSLVRVTRAVQYLGWLASRLGWRVDAPLAHARGDRLVASLVRRDRPIEAEIVAQGVAAEDPRFHAPGGLLRVEVEARHDRHGARLSIARADDQLHAEAEIDGRASSRRMAMLEHFEDAPYLAEALEARGPDATFRAALAASARLLGAAVATR